jgi:hypothetical protein
MFLNPTSDALFIVAYLINRMPSCVLKFETPIDVLSPSLPSSLFVVPRVFGCVCFVDLPSSFPW